MLKKFIAIKNVGRFQNCDAAGDVQHRRFTLIFAENGRGKTTLCDVLRSLSTGDAGRIVGRKTLGAEGEPSVKILADAGVINFSAGAWDTILPKIAIFDATFVSENVHSGDSVDIEHRRSLYRVIVGKDGVDLAKQIETLDGASRATAKEVTERANGLQLQLPKGQTVAGFMGLPVDPDIDQKIVDVEKELDAIKQANEIKSRAQLSAAALPVLPAGLEELLTKTIAGVAEDAGQRIAAHIQEHGMESRGERWLSEGLRHLREDSPCPFCDQPLAPAATLIGAYTAYFSEGYESLRGSIAPMRDAVESALGEKAVAQFEKTMDQNAQGIEFWSRFVQTTAPEPMTLVPDQIRALRHAALARLERKAIAPLDIVAPDPQFVMAAEDYATSRSAMAAYNASVAAANVAIAAKKTATGTADQKIVEATLQRLRLTKKRHEPEIVAAVALYEQSAAKKAEIEAEKVGVRKKLDDHTRAVITKYEQAINRLLSDFGAGFRITGTDHGYPGGQASSSYRILINDTPVELGDDDTPIAKPSFRNTLSGGDKSTLALAFFLAQLERDLDRAETVVVFDDPFSSQDAFRKDHTVAKIKKVGEASKQVIVFSHDRSFLKRIWDRVDAGDRKALRLNRVGVHNTTISEWDIDRDTQDRFVADRQALANYYNANEGNARDIVNKIRPVLETFCRLLYPTLFSEKEMLASIITIIRNQDAGHPLRSVVDDLDDLNEYTKRYHHGESQNAATEPIDDAELHTFVRRTLTVIGGC